jgi:hypothetical protein
MSPVKDKKAGMCGKALSSRVAPRINTSSLYLERGIEAEFFYIKTCIKLISKPNFKTNAKPNAKPDFKSNPANNKYIF